MKRTETTLEGLWVIEPDVHEDARGFFMETYHKEKFRELGIAVDFVQDSHSHSVRNVLRGLKFQYDEPTAKLVRVAYGSVFAVAVDIRPDSATFGKWEGFELSSENKRQLYLPFGFAYGFCVTSDTAGMLYKLSALHNDAGSATIKWDDTDIGISWPTNEPIISSGDAVAPSLAQWISTGGGEKINQGLKKHE